MKQYKKLIADAVLALMLILLMNYSLTGGLVHEVLGIVCLVGLLVHAFLRNKYYSAMIKALRAGRCRGKHKTCSARVAEDTAVSFRHGVAKDSEEPPKPLRNITLGLTSDGWDHGYMETVQSDIESDLREYGAGEIRHYGRDCI